ncbi:hypothetical protein CS006_03295 [Bifidobacterium primatium]|uniref:Uncharacterized protein n=1 Tax=Bifidobacterium primatium TaxID=2045438 RepID=A0A2M9HC08_9BIFI|nr:hypothetical protein CS006_03295 [Bifidobacterium primatium]
MFLEEEIDYLNSLPAVRHATQARITYEDAFKLECLRRDRRGESPARIFREAGLGSELVGSKRIERCMSRWRSDPNLQTALERYDESTRVLAATGGTDPRDILIREQATRIAALEIEVRRLRALLSRRVSHQA